MLKYAISKFNCLLQGAYVLCRLFKKNDRTPESSKCDDAGEGPSSPAVKSSPMYNGSELVTTQESPHSLKNDEHVSHEDQAHGVRNNLLGSSFFIHLLLENHKFVKNSYCLNILGYSGNFTR